MGVKTISNTGISHSLYVPLCPSFITVCKINGSKLPKLFMHTFPNLSSSVYLYVYFDFMSDYAVFCISYTENIREMYSVNSCVHIAFRAQMNFFLQMPAISCFTITESFIVHASIGIWNERYFLYF
jgi:hypothetical protein